MKKYKVEETGHYGTKMTVKQPTVENVSNVPDQNVASQENLCKSENPVKYRDCPDYNTEFCLRRCEFGAKEISGEDAK